jgi:Cu/Ag efflux protein CusF
MMTRSPRLLILSFALAAALLLPSYATAEQQEGEPAERAVMVGEKITRHGKVVSIDTKTRTVVIEGEQGRQVSIVAPADAPNFDRIKVGDPVVATYFESVALAIAPVADAEPGASATAAVSTAPPGGTPGAAMAEQIQLRAVVKAVDPKTRSVTLDVPEGGERTLKAGEAIDLERVKVGEQVSVTLTRALAISIDQE